MTGSALQDARRRPGTCGEPGERRVHVAVVSVADRVLATLASRSPDRLRADIARYVAANAEAKLWPEDAARVAEHFGSGRPEAAVRTYFGRVGRRWDPERLHVEVVELA